VKDTTSVSSDDMPWCRFERKPDETLRGALERTLRDAILSGVLRPGVRLPASRRLAEDLGVSRGVVTDAYGQLIAQGFLLTLGRTAPVTASVAPPPKHDERPHGDGVRVRYDLAPTTPDVSLFRVRRWLTTALKAGQGVAAASLDYRDPGGELALREELADHLGRTRGVIADPAQIVITHGTAQGIDLLLRILRTRRLLRVAVEDPSHTGQQVRIGAAGLTLVPQNVDSDGLLVDGLRADAVVLTPAHQFPTGAVLSEARRHRLLAWADAANAVIVEDDYDAEFRYDREPVRALQGLAPDRVIQLGTVSKTLAPALRLGWMVVPPELLEDVLHQKAVVDEFTPTLDQLTLAAYLRSGEYDRHVRKARAVYRARRDRLMEELARSLPDSCPCPPGLTMRRSLPARSSARSEFLRSPDSAWRAPTPRASCLATAGFTNQLPYTSSVRLRPSCAPTSRPVPVLSRPTSSPRARVRRDPQVNQPRPVPRL
jgi:GntR family transcriptional regulator/MocR family aminotransferase